MPAWASPSVLGPHVLVIECCVLTDRSFDREVFTDSKFWSCVSESRVKDVMPLKLSEERLTLMASGSFHGLENSRGGEKEENASDRSYPTAIGAH
jgi:hypothetical protein